MLDVHNHSRLIQNRQLLNFFQSMTPLRLRKSCSDGVGDGVREMYLSETMVSASFLAVKLDWEE